MTRTSLEIQPSKFSVAKRLLLTFCGATSIDRGGKTVGINCDSVEDCQRCDIFLVRTTGITDEDEIFDLLQEVLTELKDKSSV